MVPEDPTVAGLYSQHCEPVLSMRNQRLSQNQLPVDALYAAAYSILDSKAVKNVDLSL